MEGVFTIFCDADSADDSGGKEENCTHTHTHTHTPQIVPELEELLYEERFKEMHLTTLKRKRERGDLTTLYKLMNNLEETDRKDLIL